MGYQALRRGFFGLKDTSFKDRWTGKVEKDLKVLRGIKGKNGVMLDTILSQKQINKLATPFFSQAMQTYTDFKMFGLPHGKGMYEEHRSVLDIIKILESESNEFDAWEMENQKYMK